MKKVFKEIPIKASTLLRRLPKEIQCFGFKISDLDVSFKKSQMQLTAYQQPVDEIDQEVCDKFHEDLNSHQSELLKNVEDG